MYNILQFMRLFLAYSGKTDGDRLKESTFFHPQQRFYSNIEYYHNKREQNENGYAFGARASSKCPFVCTWLVIPCFFTFSTFCVSSFFCVLLFALVSTIYWVKHVHALRWSNMVEAQLKIPSMCWFCEGLGYLQWA